MYKIGDLVQCIPGFSNQGGGKNDPNYGGSGYVENKIFEIKKISSLEDKRYVVWGDSGSGIYYDALKLVNNKTYKKRKLEL